MGNSKEEIQEYLRNFVKEFSACTGGKFSLFSKEEQYLYLYTYYHYFNADPSKFDDIANGVVYNQNSQDHIVGIYEDEESDDDDVDVVIVVYYRDGDSFLFPSFAKYLRDAEYAYIDYTRARSEIRDFLKENDEFRISKRPLKVRLITNYTPKAAERNKISRAFSVLKPENSKVTYEITFGDELAYEILEIENPKEYVDKASLLLDTDKNYTVFGSEKSVIVNISAKSLKNAYEMYGYRGLFSQNLRYYVKNAKIDERIIESIQNDPENFWYYNNGIIIICSDYEITGQEVHLREFSIINGGQTTKLIGETDFDTDFFVQCKIIKNKYTKEEDRLSFISSVAEASNTQKPIKPKDLIANRPEQRLLKKQLAEVGVYCQVKRGEKVNKKLYPQAWQNTTNEELGQFLLAFMYQVPGTARGNKASICGNKDKYALIFGKKYDSQLLCDLLKIKAFYKLWVTELKKTDRGTDPYKIGLANNGMFYITSIIGAICKVYYNMKLLSEVLNSPTSEQKMELLSQFDIDHHIFIPGLVEKQRFFDLFEYCYTKFYRPGYEFVKEFKPNTSYSNFTKPNTGYNTYVMRMFLMEYHNGIEYSDISFLSTILHSASPEEIIRDSENRRKYVNIIATGASDLPVSIVKAIKDALQDYRTLTYKQRGIKAYEVFTNKSLARIAEVAPLSMDALKSARCLDDLQLDLYGEEIVNVVKDVVEG